MATSRSLMVVVPVSNLSTGTSSDFKIKRYQNIFDQLDKARPDITVDTADGIEQGSASTNGREQEQGTKNVESMLDHPWSTALADTTHRIFPTLGPNMKVRSVEDGDEELPGWMRETSGRVTTISAARVHFSAFQSQGDSEETDVLSRDNLRAGPEVLRVAVGCEDGNIWIFGPVDPLDEVGKGIGVSVSAATSPMSPLFSNQYDSTTRMTRSTSAISSDRLQSLSDTSAPPSRSSSPAPSSTHRPKRLNHPVSVYSKPRQPSTPGVISPSGTRLASPASTISSRPYDMLMSAPSPRLRKASATISISTSPQMSSDQLSSSETTTTALPSLAGHQAFTLAAPPTGRRSSRGHHHHHHGGNKGVESVTSGIGLWESNSHPTLFEDLLSPALAENGDAVEFGVATETEMEELRPILRIRLAGGGEISKLCFVEGLRVGREEGGKVIVCLRRNGQLSVHSIVDGRTLASGHAAEKVASSSKHLELSFDGFEIVPLADTTTAVCFSREVGLVTIDLDTMEALAPVDMQCENITPAIIFKQGDHYIVSCAKNASESSDMIVRPILVDITEEEGIQRRRASIKPLHNAGPLPGISNQVRGIRSCADDLLVYDDEGILLCTIRDQKVTPLARLDLVGICDICVEGYRAILLSTKDLVRTYQLVPSADRSTGYFSFQLINEFPISSTENLSLVPLSTLSPFSASFITAHYTVTNRSLSLISVLRSSDSVKLDESKDRCCRKVFDSAASTASDPKDVVTTYTLIDNERIILGYNSGVISERRYLDLSSTSSSNILSGRLSGAITLVRLFDYRQRQIIIAGSAEGEVGVWNLSDWSEIARWNVFATPIANIIYLAQSTSPSLLDSFVLISVDSTVAIASLASPDSMFLLPGTRATVAIVSTAKVGDELMIVYSSGLSRIFDIAAQELRRSMDSKTAEGLLKEGNWVTWYDTTVMQSEISNHIDPLLSIDLRQTIDNASHILPWQQLPDLKLKSNGNGDQRSDLMADTKNSRDHLGLVRLLLAHAVTFGIDEGADQALVDHLEIIRPVGITETILSNPSSCSELQSWNPSDIWTISPMATAQRLLRIVCLLRVFLNFPDTERYATQLITFYATCLHDAVGPTFVGPSLAELAIHWVDCSNEVQQAARLLFNAYLASTPDRSIVSLAEEWQDLLPSRQIDITLNADLADQAVLVIGLIAAEKYKLLSPTTLKEVSTSISLYLASHSHPGRQAIATVLCSLGFSIWQNYVSAADLLRFLFILAIGKQSGELRTLARSATIHVATVNTPLFMTTLLYDILNEQDAGKRNGTLKLLGFMLRKKPLVLYTSLPRLAEAVVKSLDPTITSLRETVHEAATVILNELVRTYPSIDFHTASQRLAVGTHEGAIIIYDLRTATRLSVLSTESHTRPITAVSFSPDGRRLVSASLEGSRVVVWKVGGGFFLGTLFGGIGRKSEEGGGVNGGGSGEKPWKSLEFNVGEEGLMTAAATLEWVGFEWTDRTARLRIRETALTFSV